jgi:cytochrome c-type biogenesis protein CcmF
MALVGRGALALALLLALYAVVTSVLAGRRRDLRYAESARHALYAVLAAVLVADFVFLLAIVRHDFSFVTVADTTSRELPFGYLLSSFWGSQAGSLMLWLTILSSATVIVIRTNRRSHGELMPWVMAIMGGTAAFFALLVVVAASPFETQVAPADGAGLNPSLQNPYMVAHPPALYLGYVGLTIPFAFCMAALAAGRRDARWIVSTRRWTLAAWAFLGVGMLLGSHWAYVEVGWGGYWAWDPVENAALMPWLTATAYLHSVMVQEKKGMLKVWNAALVAATFALCIFGTFLTRSGILSSIHAFVESNIGWYFVGFIALIAVVSIGLIVWRLPLLKAENRMESLVSREATFLFNNLLLVGIAFAVLWGVLFPLISETVGDDRLNVTNPFFEFFAVAFGLPLVFLMGVGPLIAWRRASIRSLERTFMGPALTGLATGALLVLFGYGTSWPGVAAVSLCAFVAVTIVLEFARGGSARRALMGESWPRALVSLTAKNRRRYGGYIVHLAMVLLVIGVVGSSAYTTQHTATLAPGQSLDVQDYTLTFNRLTESDGPNYTSTGAELTVAKGGDVLGTLTPERRSYPAEGQNTNEPAIRSSLLTGEDLFVILDGVSAQGEAAVKVLVNPLVNLIWLSGFVFVAGCLIAAWPDRRETKRLQKRYAEEPVAGEV